jgi:hypothetical protein
MVVTLVLGVVRYRILSDRDFDGAKEDPASFVMSLFDDCMTLCNLLNYFQARTSVGCTYDVCWNENANAANVLVLGRQG